MFRVASPKTLDVPSPNLQSEGREMIQDAFFISVFLLVVGIILAVIAWGSWGGRVVIFIFICRLMVAISIAALVLLLSTL